MLGLEPLEVERAADQLRSVARNADALVDDVRQLLILARMPSAADRSLLEVADEIDQLARVLRDRAELARSFRLPLPTEASRLRSLGLWESITDQRGARARLAGDRLLAVILDANAVDHDGFISRDHLEIVSTDDGASPIVRRAADELRSSPLFDVVLADAMASSEAPASAAARRGRVLPAALGATLARNELIRRQALDAVVPDASLISLAINRFAFAQSPEDARQFLASLPNPTSSDVSIDIRTIETDGLAELHRSALTGLGHDDLAQRHAVLAQLPESSDGYRNTQISAFYGEVAGRLDHLANGTLAGDPTTAGHAGANWAHFGAAASFSVGPTIRGEQRSYGFTPPPVLRQAFADGNHIIVTDVGHHFARMLEMFEDTEISAATVEEFLSGFTTGQRDLQIAFANQLAASIEWQPARRQALQLDANVGMGVHEQAIVDHLVDFDRLPIGQRVGSHVATGLSAGLRNPLSLWIPLTPNGGPWSKTRGVAEVASDDGALTVPGPDGALETIPVGEPLRPGPTENRLVGDADFQGLANPAQHRLGNVPLPGDLTRLDDIGGIEEAYGLSNDYRLWWEQRPHVETRQWDDFADRMPFIANMMREHHTNPALFEGSDHLAQAAT